VIYCITQYTIDMSPNIA